MGTNKWTSSDISDQKGKLYLITGANSGIGLEASGVLAKKGAGVIMAVRDSEKGKAAANKIKKEFAGADIQVMRLDLADLDSIKKFTQDFIGAYQKLDVLINNAGVMWPARRLTTKQGFEMQLGVNHLGHFALTGLLLGTLKKTPGSRIVTQSSLAHKYRSDIYFNDLNLEKKYNKKKAYSQSKLANLLFTYELDRRLKDNHIRTVAVACHPGVTSTNLFRYSGFSGNLFMSVFGMDVEKGTLPVLRAATEKGLTGGEFFGPDRLTGVRGYPVKVRSSKKSYDEQLAKHLWEVSERLTGINYNFSDQKMKK